MMKLGIFLFINYFAQGSEHEKCPSVRDKKIFYEENNEILKRLVDHHEHMKTKCQPIIRRMRCEQIGNIRNEEWSLDSLFECRAKLYWHKKYKGSLTVGETPENPNLICTLTFHHTKNSSDESFIMSSPMKNKCEIKKKRKITAWGPWSKCLDSSCDTDLAIKIRRRYCNGKKFCDDIDFDDWMERGKPSNKLIQWKPCKKCSKDSSSSSSSSSSSKSSSKSSSSGHSSSHSFSSHSEYIESINENYSDGQLGNELTTTNLATTTASTLLPNTKCSLTISLEDYDDVMVNWPSDRPGSEYDCNQFDFFDNFERKYSQCECIQLIEETARDLRKIKNELDEYILSLQVHYPVFKSDCKKKHFYDQDHNKLSLTQCMKWRESTKNQVRHKIQNFEYELYDRYDLYLRK